MNRTFIGGKGDKDWRAELSGRSPSVDRLNLKPEELCRRREWVFPAHLTAQQIRALEMLKAKRDLFL